MTFQLDAATLLFGIVIFFARVGDVTLGTLRTISIVQGRTWTAFFLALVEISLWLAVISTVILEIGKRPILGLFYAFGFAAGNVMGITIERKVAFGYTILRVITAGRGREMAGRIREMGYGVTTFAGEGATGPVTELYIVCRRRNLKKLVPVVRSIEPQAFFITEQAGMVSKMYRPAGLPPTGWRSILKKK